MKGRLIGLFLSLGLVATASAADADETSANLRLMAFGSDAQLTAVKHAVDRFNQKFPNVKVENAIDPISNGGNADDVCGTAIETFQTFEARGLFLPLDDYIARDPSYSD